MFVQEDLMFHLIRPLKTQKIRVAEEQERMKKYPKTTIRVRFPDSTMLQATFKSSERGTFDTTETH